MGDSEELNVEDSSLERYNADSNGAIAVRSLEDIKRISTIFIESGMFKGDKGLSQKQQLYQAGVKIIAGVEFGIQPFAAMRGINIINGNAEMSANLMAAKVKKHPKYDYRVTKWDNDGCEIEFFEVTPARGIGIPAVRESLGRSSFTKTDAEQAGLTSNLTWRKFPRNMCFARAMSNGVRIYTPDVFYGAPVYVEGEISGDFDTEAEATAEPVNPVEEPHVDESVEGEVVETKPVATPGAGSTPEIVALHLTNLNLVPTRARQLVRETTGKPFLKNCDADDLDKLADALMDIENGRRTLPQDWYDSDEEAA